MDYYRKLAIIAGVLFIIYTGVDILSFLFLGSVTAPNYLVSVSENAGLVGTGALLLFIGGACGSGIAISLYPVLKKFNAGLALGAVGFRISEGVLRFVAVCGYLLLITLSQQFVQAGAPDSSYFQTLGALVYAGNRWVQSCVAAGFFHRCSAILHHILSNKTSSSMDIGLGSCCCHIGHVIMRVSHGRSHRSFWYGTSRYEIFQCSRKKWFLRYG